jgi:hypothetical protein
VTLTCQSCGRPFEAKRTAAKFCGDTCRKRAQRAPRETEAPLTVMAPITAPPLVRTTRRALEEAGVVDSVPGQQALLLAERMSNPHETGAAVASMSKQLQAVVSEALRSVKRSDPLDELRGRRDAKRVAG